MLELVRFAMLEDRTIGRLTCGDQHFWTVEKPWRDNEPFVSCIPSGTYDMATRNSPRFGPGTWEILDVPGRSHILIHVGNTADDVVGCISIGTTLFPTLEGVQSSRKAMKMLTAMLADVEETTITITEGHLVSGGSDASIDGELPEAE